MLTDLESHDLLSSSCCHLGGTFAFISSVTDSSERQQGQGTGWRDGNEPRVINQAMQERDKTSIEKKS